MKEPNIIQRSKKNDLNPDESKKSPQVNRRNLQANSKSSPKKGNALSNFWKKSPTTKVPGTIKQIRGIKCPPLTTFPGKKSIANLRAISTKTSSTRTSSTTTTATLTTTKPSSSTTSLTTTTTTTKTQEQKSPTDSESQEHITGSRDKVGLTLKQQKFEKLLRQTNVDMKALRTASWAGIPPQVRGTVWQLLLGYLPPNLIRRGATLKKRREEYNIILDRHYTNVIIEDDTILKQILVDIPRTSPKRKFFQHPEVQKSLERILYLWAIRHPASGYVQGINDLATPFYMVFLSQLTGQSISDYETKESAENLTKDQLFIVEADCFWCLSLVLDAIQDHYTFAQPGLQKMVFKLQELINRIDATLHDHIVNQEVQFIQFAFRWMNCLLMREISLPLIIRSWDTCLAEENGSGFKIFHVYICAAFLMRWEKELKTMEFQDLVMFLQSLPTKDWQEKEIETLLSQAYVYQTYFQESPNHLH